MRRKTYLVGFQKFRSEERCANLNRAWQYLTPLQKLSIYIRVIWYAAPSVLQVLNHAAYFYGQWIDEHFFADHMVK